MLVVDDGSPDGTADRAEKVGAELGGIHVLRRRGKAGLGTAYRAGFAWGIEQGYDIVVEMDADLSHDPAALPMLVAPVEEGTADLVVGSRYIPGGAIPDWPWHRRALSRYGNLYAATALGLPVRDSTSGFRAYQVGMLRGLGLRDLRADGYGFQIEMAYRVVLAGGAVDEVPIVFTDRIRGTSKMSGRIVVEAMVLVTWWAIRDRLRGRHPPKAQRWWRER